jgi:anaerobic magnesium-protoporphyrin IX monomethyl ester cyclase
MRVALINPPQPYLIEPGRTRPLGLMYLHSAVRNACPDVWVDICDLADETVEAAIERLVSGQYDVFAWSATSRDYPLVEKLAQQVAAKTHGFHVLGGPHATAVDKHHYIFRVIFKGEGEQTFPAFLKGLRKGEYKTVYGGARIEELDNLHFPYRGGPPQGRIMAAGGDTSATIMGSRGCAHNCAFCAAKCLWPGRVRFRSPKSIAREVELLRDKGGIQDFVFWDENLTSSTQHLRETCAALKPLRIRWRAQARVDTVDRTKLKMMREAGCREVDFGVESFDNHVLECLCKRTTAELNKRAIELAYEADIPSRLYMMISTPGETYQETVEWNKQYLTELQGKYSVVCSNVFMPLPGTAVYESPEKFGVRFISRDFSRYFFYQYRREDGKITNESWSPIEIVGMSREEQMANIDEMQKFMGTLGAVNKGTPA